MSQYVVTIARQFGSLGRPIAKALAEILGIEYYDRDIVEATAEKMGLPVSVISDQEEKVKSGFFQMGFPLGMGSTEQQIEIFNEQAKIIRDLAERQSCIIVGRCSDYVLQNQKNCIHIFIYAPYERRVRNCVDFLHMNEDVAKQVLAKVDKARDSYHKTFAQFAPGDYRHKDILIDSSLLGIEGTAKVIADIVRTHFMEEKLEEDVEKI